MIEREGGAAANEQDSVEQDSVEKGRAERRVFFCFFFFTSVNLWNSSQTSTTRSRRGEGFMRPRPSNSCQALGTEL